ncbi:Putative lipoprotein YerB precursor [Eubacteriaceae bacterium CHKCI005]|nr:Putative lipoprotein YerB precursor [Eubacteriaceae bacterium CHKCI005]
MRICGTVFYEEGKMILMKKTILCFLTAACVLMSCLCLSSCGKKEAESASSASSGASTSAAAGSDGQSPQASSPAGTQAGTINPLTGRSDLPSEAVGQRPVGIMINNLEAATPQHNIASADVCYEMQAEGGITRILALYSDWRNLSMTGSIRSARPYFVELAQSHDCIYVHVGGSQDALDAIQSSKVDSINGVSDSVTIWRDPGRKKSMGSVHSCVTDGEKLIQCVQKREIRTQAKSGGTAFSFRAEGDSQAPQGQSCKTLTVPFSSYVTSRFVYDSQKAVYAKYQFDKGQMDAATGKQVEVENVLVLRTAITPTGDSLGHVDIQLKGGEGIYASMGRCQNIRWSMESASDPIQLTDSSGQELSLNPGKTWICIVGQKDDVTAE